MRTFTIAILTLFANIIIAQTNSSANTQTTTTTNTSESVPSVKKVKTDKAEDKPCKCKLTRFTEINFAVNNTNFSNAKNVRTFSDNAWELGISKRHQLSSRLDLSYGASILKTQHQLTYMDNQDKFQEVGERGYVQTYFRVPLNVYYEIMNKKPYFVTAGINVNSVLLNYSAESYTRTQVADNTAKSVWKYRETALLDMGLRIGVGTRMQVANSVFTFSLAYNQGTITKDMGMKQRQIEAGISMSIPKKLKIRGMGTNYKSSPAPWLN